MDKDIFIYSPEQAEYDATNMSGWLMIRYCGCFYAGMAGGAGHFNRIRAQRVRHRLTNNSNFCRWHEIWIRVILHLRLNRRLAWPWIVRRI